MGDDVVSRPEYELHMRAGLAEAANLLAAEAAAQQVAIERPFNGLRMRARPGATGAQVVVDWYYDLGCARETRQRQERDAVQARAEAAEQRAEAAEAEVGRLRAELAAMPRPEDRCHGAWPCEASTALASAEAEAARWEARAEAAEAELARARADARVLACQWRAVDDTEDLQFFGACWREAHPGRSEGDLGRDPTMTDLVAALRRAIGGAA